VAPEDDVPEPTPTDPVPVIAHIEHVTYGFR
jgi:hypothetical protein